MTTTTNKATIGSISTGTLFTEDLLEPFADELRRLSSDPSHMQMAFRADGLVLTYENPEYNAERDQDADFLLEGLTQALESFAPPFFYFGAKSEQGDGSDSDFGFWPDEGTIQQEQAEELMAQEGAAAFDREHVA